MKNSSILTADVEADSSTHSALTTNYKISTDISCPFTNGTDQTTSNGMKFQIYCNQDMNLNDYCPIGGPTPGKRDGVCPYHADTLDECMDICSRAAPLCQAVAWNPDESDGYGNCYPKTALSPANYISVTNAAPARHMAVAVDIPTLDETCTNGTTTNASNGEGFEVSCNDNRAGNDIEQVHAENITACVSACATFNNATAGDCMAVMYDSTMASGWRNCWLKSAEGTKEVVTGNIFALKTGTSSSSGGSSSGSSSIGSSSSHSGGSSSKAWIAGAVIGIIAVVAIVGVAVWYFRRRQATHAPQTVSEMPGDAAAPPPVYPVYAKEKTAEHTYHELQTPDHDATAPAQPFFQHEADSGQVHELPVTAK
jgi:hypothetical protein